MIALKQFVLGFSEYSNPLFNSQLTINSPSKARLWKYNFRVFCLHQSINVSIVFPYSFILESLTKLANSTI